MLIDFHKRSKPVDVNMHQDKTKVMFNDCKSTISVDGKIIEEADSSVYPERHSRETVV